MVCGEPATFIPSDSEPVCFRGECRIVVAQKERMSAFVFEQFFLHRSRQIRETIARVALREKRKREIEERENRENEAYWEKVIHSDRDLDPEQHPYVVIPAFSRKITTLPEPRRVEYREFLQKLIDETMGTGGGAGEERAGRDGSRIEEKSSQEEEDLEDRLEVRACSLCRGHCCRLGGNHAYLAKETLLRHLGRHPDDTPERVLASYMDRLPEKSFAGSCVNHGESGCALPREMRAHTCIAFTCSGLKALRRIQACTPVPEGVFFICRRQNDSDENDSGLASSIVASELVLTSGGPPPSCS